MKYIGLYFPEVLGAIRRGSILSLTQYSNSMLMLTISLQGAAGKPGEHGSNGDKVHWTISFVVLYYMEVKRSLDGVGRKYGLWAKCSP